MADFNKAFDPIFIREGGSKITEDPDDAGGLTRYGICKRSYPNEDIRNLTLDRAKFLYRRDFWNKVGGDGIRNQSIADMLADCAVLEGPVPAIKRAQSIVHLPATGKTTPELITKLNSMP